MYRETRRKDRLISKEEAMEVLSLAEYGVLATVSEDNTPYAVPLSFMLMEGKIYFHCAKTGHKLDNIAKNPNVCFNAVSRTDPVSDANNYSLYYESATVFGKAAIVQDGDEKKKALLKLVEKHFPSDMEQFEKVYESSKEHMEAVSITIEHITGKAKR